MHKVELIFDTACPNVNEARENLAAAIEKAALTLNVKEWNRDDPAAPGYVTNYGSPTILVNGKDITSSDSSSDANCCRVYRDENNKMSGVPSVQLITEALLQATGNRHNRGCGWKKISAIFPVIALVVIPGISCPACWPAYAGLLSSLGVGFINYTPYLLPLMAVMLLIALVSLGFKAKTRRGYSPLVLGSLGAALILLGKFVIVNAPALYAGIAILIIASVWNALPLNVQSRKVQGKTYKSCCNPKKQIQG